MLVINSNRMVTNGGGRVMLRAGRVRERAGGHAL